MRIYISVDMEGVAGVVHEDQTDPIDPRHARIQENGCEVLFRDALQSLLA